MDLVPQKDTGDPEIAADAAFGTRVKEARRARGWSQWELARAITPPVSQATISAIERGDTASSAVLAVCRVLDIAPPSVGETPEMSRWIDAGRVLVRFPEVFEYHLRQLEVLAATLVAARRDSDPDPKTPRH